VSDSTTTGRRSCTLAVVLCVLPLSVACRSITPDLPGEGGVDYHEFGEGHPEAAESEHWEVSTRPPPFSEGIFPCSECHEYMELNTKVRKLTEEHSDILLQHGDRERWCFDCHSPENRDKLRLASGELIDFSESYKLCGQCHGPKLRDWKAGVHGKRSGEWNGKKEYLLCAHCHFPHSPRFKPVEPELPPEYPNKCSEYARAGETKCP